MLFSLVYVSRATLPMTRAGLLEILRHSRQHNAGAHITGLLLHRGGTFLQMLEGQQSRVEALYTSIARDPRHRDVTTVVDGAQPVRQFPDWSMGFNDLDHAPVEVDGYSGVLDHGDPTRPEAGFVRDLLDLFDDHG